MYQPSPCLSQNTGDAWCAVLSQAPAPLVFLWLGRLAGVGLWGARTGCVVHAGPQRLANVCNEAEAVVARAADLRATTRPCWPRLAGMREEGKRTRWMLPQPAAHSARPPARLSVRAASWRDRHRRGFEPLAHEDRDHARAQVPRDV